MIEVKKNVLYSEVRHNFLSYYLRTRAKGIIHVMNPNDFYYNHQLIKKKIDEKSEVTSPTDA